MKLTKEYIPYLHETRRREIILIFSKCPKKLFNNCLELGAGDGFQSTLLTKYVINLISTDFNPEILQKENTDSIKYTRCDAEEIDYVFNEKEFDLIFSSNLFEHLPSPKKALASIYKILKDDGITIHIMPNPFWKICKLLLHIPNLILKILEAITEKNGFNKLLNEFHGNEDLNGKINPYGDNPKIRRPKKSRIYRLFIPEPHGVSSNHIKEILAFSKFRWKKDFKKANFDLVKIMLGPITTGYGFGFEKIKMFLKNVGISSEYIYIATKKGRKSKYENYF